jgi:nitrite reductase/ring-hydroxylating ferredoxin subunit
MLWKKGKSLGSIMRTQKLGKLEEFMSQNPRIVEVRGKFVGIYHHDGKFYAYENMCPHEGGPACEGIIVGNTVCELMKDESSPSSSQNYREFLSQVEMNIACPWHGIEYNIKTGKCIANRNLRLKKFQVKAKKGILEIEA